jgi:outer membrane receptor protein involved in Fe transport
MEFLDPLHRMVLLLPVITTFCAVFFVRELATRYRAKGGGAHLLWWGLGMVTYGLGTATEAYTSIFGWHPVVFRLWYIVGAFLGGYPLAQGSIFLLMSRKFARRSAWIVTSLIAAASCFVLATPLNAALAEAHRLSGSVIEWSWVRLMSPFINIYSLIFLVGGAVVSALRFRRFPDLRHRYLGNIWIAVGALLPGIGGSLTRAGYVEALYITELVGLLCIYRGYRLNIAGKPVAETTAPLATGGLRMKSTTTLLVLALAGALLFAAPPIARANDNTETQDVEAPATGEPTEEEDSGEAPSFFDLTTVTATLSESPTFGVPAPVIVIGAKRIEALQPDSATDLLRTEPGVDVNGVGPNQTRPVIRGQRGHRILFLQDGIRMNNTRRQTDFGEITGLVDVSNVETMEVVRGAGSVLYGSDAIGGVLNLITKVPPIGQGFKASAGARLSDSDEQVKFDASIRGVNGRFSYGASAATRDAEAYEAPAGTFGEITLTEDVVVNDTGVEDDNYALFLGYNVDDQKSLYFRADSYRAENAGFGYVDPEFSGESFLNRITYPYHDFERYSLGYVASWERSTLDLKVYNQNNERENGFFIDVNTGPAFGPGTGPDGSVVIDSLIFSDVETAGLRLESTRSLNDQNLLTWGGEWYEDDSFNTRASSTTVSLRAFFPISFICGPAGGVPVPPTFFFECAFVDETDRASAPNATNTASGIFVQNEYFGRSFTATAGLRFASSKMEATATPQWDVAGLDFKDEDVVGSLGLVYNISPSFNLVGSVATAFRTPNLIERLFNGITPEGSGYQVLNADLMSETSTNLDIGLKYNNGGAFFEVNYFDTEIDDAIIQYSLTENDIAALPADIQAEVAQAGVSVVVQQRNADVFTINGVELTGAYRFDNGFTLGGNYTSLDGEAEVGGPAADPTGQTFSEKFGGFARYEEQDGRWWAEYRVRHNGEEDQQLDPNAIVPPVGRVLPSFTVQDLAAGVRLPATGKMEHSFGLVVNNLGDELYAEFSNASFFRPQPGRRIITTYRMRF